MSFIPILDLKKATKVYMYNVHGLILGNVATTLHDRRQPPWHGLHQVLNFTLMNWIRGVGRQGPDSLYRNRSRFVTAQPIFFKFLVHQQNTCTYHQKKFEGAPATKRDATHKNTDAQFLLRVQ